MLLITNNPIPDNQAWVQSFFHILFIGFVMFYWGYFNIILVSGVFWFLD